MVESELILWFINKEDAVTHFCGGIPQDSTEIRGNRKPKEVDTELSKWFYPADRVEETDEYKCKACGDKGNINNMTRML